MAVRNKQPKTVIISPQAKEDINNILYYLSQTWNQKVVDEFLKKLEVFYYKFQLIHVFLGILISKKISENILSPNKISFITEIREMRSR